MVRQIHYGREKRVHLTLSAEELKELDDLVQYDRSDRNAVLRDLIRVAFEKLQEIKT